MKKGNLSIGRNHNYNPLLLNFSKKGSKKNLGLNKFALSQKVLQNYSVSNDLYNMMVINAFLFSKKGHYQSIYKDIEIFSDEKENLKRVYDINDCKERIPKYAYYYKDYLKYFCKPLISALSQNKIIIHNMEKIAQEFYNNNYKEKKINKQANYKKEDFIFFNYNVIKDIERQIEFTNENKNDDTRILLSSLLDVSSIVKKSRNTYKPTEQSLNTSLSSLISILVSNKDNRKEMKKPQLNMNQNIQNNTSKEIQPPLISNYISGMNTNKRGLYKVKLNSGSLRNIRDYNKSKRESSLHNYKSIGNFNNVKLNSFKSPKVTYSKYSLRLVTPLTSKYIDSPKSRINVSVKDNILSSPSRRGNINIVNNLQNGYLGKTKLSLYQKKVKSFTTRVNENSEERKFQKVKMLNNLYSGGASTIFKKDKHITIEHKLSVSKVRGFRGHNFTNVLKYKK